MFVWEQTKEEQQEQEEEEAYKEKKAHFNTYDCACAKHR